MTRNIKTMLLLLLVAFLYVFVFGCEDTGDISISVEGKIEDWKVENLDTAIEKAVEPVLDFGDDVVEVARDVEKKAIKWGNDPQNDPNDLSMEGFFGTD